VQGLGCRQNDEKGDQVLHAHPDERIDLDRRIIISRPLGEAAALGLPDCRFSAVS
jgi:hypothetical protein